MASGDKTQTTVRVMDPEVLWASGVGASVVIDADKETTDLSRYEEMALAFEAAADGADPWRTIQVGVPYDPAPVRAAETTVNVLRSIAAVYRGLAERAKP